MQTPFSIYNGLVPELSGPLCLPYYFNFVGAAAGGLPTITDDFFKEESGGVIDKIQGVWIDNTNNPQVFILTLPQTGQQIEVAPGLQCIAPLFAPTPLKFSGTCSGIGVTQVIFLNVPVAPMTWGTLRGNFVNNSGVIAAGGVSQLLLAADTLRQRLIVHNPLTAAGQGIVAAESIFINFGAAATIAGGNSFEIVSGGYFDTGGGPLSGQAVNIIATTVNHQYVAKHI